jgi:hypothetical protein
VHWTVTELRLLVTTLFITFVSATCLIVIVRVVAMLRLVKCLVLSLRGFGLVSSERGHVRKSAYLVFYMYYTRLHQIPYLSVPRCMYHAFMCVFILA